MLYCTEMSWGRYYLSPLVAMAETKVRPTPATDAVTERAVLAHDKLFGGFGGLNF